MKSISRWIRNNIFSSCIRRYGGKSEDRPKGSRRCLGPILAVRVTVFGLQVMKDVAGTSEFSTTQLLPAANYSLPLGGSTNSYLSLGVMGGLRQQRFDPTKLQLDDQFVAGSNGSFSLLPASAQVFNNTNITYFDLSVGVSWNGSVNDNVDFFLGAGMFHLTKPKVGFFAGEQIVQNKKAAFNPGLSVATSESDQLILYADQRNLIVIGDDHTSFSAGLLYRLDDAIIPVAQMELSNFVIGVSYDINVSKLAVASQSRGGLELTLSYKDFLNILSKDHRIMKCPRFGGHMPNVRYNGY